MPDKLWLISSGWPLQVHDALRLNTEQYGLSDVIIHIQKHTVWSRLQFECMRSWDLLDFFLEHICWLLCKNVYAFLSSKFYHKSKKIKKETLTSVKLACYMIFGGKPLNVTLFSACFLNVLNKSRCMFFSSCACILIRTLYIVQLRLSAFNIQEWSVIVIGQKYGTAARAHNKSSHIDSL